MGLDKKILINGAEAYVQINKSEPGEATLNWIVGTIHKCMRMARLNYDYISDSALYDYLHRAAEILNLNGFDYSAEQPDYSVIESDEIGVKRLSGTVKFPDAAFQNPSDLAVVTAVSIFPLNAAWHRQFGELAQEDIVDWVNLAFRQPFYMQIVKADETAAEEADGEIQVVGAWGGDDNLQYSIDDGATWQAGAIFPDLLPGDYNVKVKDGLGNESLSRGITINEGE